MKTKTNLKIEQKLTAILDWLNQLKIIRLLNLQSIDARRNPIKATGSCTACNNYQYKEKKR